MSRFRTPYPTPGRQSSTHSEPGAVSAGSNAASQSSTYVVRDWGDHGAYIPGLDGLRALAVISVVLYHILPVSVRGGFLGVDLFFVISGFLITTLLLREDRRTGRINIKKFWIRRVRRLVPALVTLTLIVVPIAWAVHRDLMVGIGRQVLGSLTFSYNWLEILHGSSYFDLTSPQLFKNFWSLAVEEQFYLFWPLIFIFLVVAVRSWKVRSGILCGVSIASAAAMAILYDDAVTTRVYYGTDTHLFGLAMGIALAFMWASPGGGLLGSKAWTLGNRIFGLLALAGFIALVITLPDVGPWAYCGGIFLASVLALIVIASVIAPGSLLARFLELQPFVWIGTRSYGLYLWHWPVLVIARTLVPVAPGSRNEIIESIVALAITCVICELSFRFVETPLRTRGILASLGLFFGQMYLLRNKIVAAVVVILTIATGTAIALAPAKSSVQEEIEQNQALIDDGAASSAGTPSPAPGTGAGGTATPKPGSTASGAPSQQGSEAPSGKPSEAPGAQASASPAAPPSAPAEKPMGKPTFDVTMPTGRDITAIGDSLIVTSRGGLDHAMPGINFVAKSNRQWKHAPAVVDEALAKGEVRRVVILDFGTNAGVPDGDVVRNVIRKLGPNRVVVIMTIYGVSTFIEPANDLLKQIAAEFPNVVVADWWATASKHPEILQPDRTHPTIAGARIFGQVTWDAIHAFFLKAEAAAK